MEQSNLLEKILKFNITSRPRSKKKIRKKDIVIKVHTLFMNVNN